MTIIVTQRRHRAGDLTAEVEFDQPGQGGGDHAQELGAELDQRLVPADRGEHFIGTRQGLGEGEGGQVGVLDDARFGGTRVVKDRELIGQELG